MRRKLFLLAVILCTILSFDVFGQEYSTSVELIEQTENALVVRSVGVSDKNKKQAEKLAVQSAFYTLFYRGISGYNNGAALILKDNKYYVNKFLEERYVQFARNIELISVEDVPSTPKKFMATVKLDIAIKPLIKDLTLEKLMGKPVTEISMEETKVEVGLPTITVVPYRQETQTYKDIFQNNADLRMAVARVQDGFNKKGVTTIDFEARLEAMWRSREFNTEATQSEEKLLLDNSGADVYVVVDFKKEAYSDGNRVWLNLKAYETASGSILASSVGWTNKGYANFATLCVEAVNRQIDSFLNDIKINFAKGIKEGKSITLRINRTEESLFNLNSGIGNTGYPLASVIRRWVRANAQDGQCHLQGVVADQMIFDYVKIPSVDADGLPMDAAQFGDNLLFYLTMELKVPCKMQIDGQTIHITLQ